MDIITYVLVSSTFELVTEIGLTQFINVYLTPLYIIIIEKKFVGLGSPLYSGGIISK